jgi:hypothetical protein
MAHGMTVIKDFSYQGRAGEEWSNTYFFAGGSTPTDDTAWNALLTALANIEKPCYPASVRIVRAYGYDSDAEDAHAVWTKDLVAGSATIPGTLTVDGTNANYPGDVAAWVRWGTSRMSRGKRIYLRKYFHGVVAAQSNNRDEILTAQRTAYNALGLKLRDGTFLDSRTLTARGHTDTLVGHAVSTYATTRTLKRRAKRNPS